MRFSPDRCVGCGSSEGWVVIPDSGYWFCTTDCYIETIEKNVPARFNPDKDAEHDPEYKAIFKEMQDELWSVDQLDAHHPLYIKLRNFEDWFETQKKVEYKKAWENIEKRAAAEWRRHEKEEQVREREMKEKQEAADIRERERLQREQERQDDRDRREQERLELQQEKLRKQQEEEQLKIEQEAAWEETLTPKPIPDKIRLEHTMVIGSSGSGKTTLLQNNLLEDFLVNGKINPNPPIYCVIDPKGLMIERLSKLLVFNRDYKDRIVIIDPLDAPALNLFQTLGRDPAQLISDFSYIFSTTKQKLTGKQTTCFSFCARLLFTLPHANLVTLLDLLDDRNKKPPNPIFQEAIPKLPEIARRFFEQDYYAPNYASTREEIKARIYGVAQNDHLARMFNANTRKLDLARCIKEKKIILVNTRMTQLAEDHQTLGRYIISLLQDAIQSRTERHPVYLIIDEFQEFADPEKTPRLLRLLREYGGGAVLAFQNMYCAELDDATRNAISTNTSIKYASSPEGQDLGYLARDLRCEPEFLKERHKTATHAQFACYVRGMQKHPFIVHSQLGWIDKWPKMNDEAYGQLRARNKAALQDDPPPKTHKPPHIEGESVTASRPSEGKPIVRDPSKIGKWTPPK
jgi:hypothetical protein